MKRKLLREVLSDVVLGKDVVQVFLGTGRSPAQVWEVLKKLLAGEGSSYLKWVESRYGVDSGYVCDRIQSLLDQIENFKKNSPYHILGVEFDSSPSDIRKRWRELVKAWHPDVSDDRETAQARLKDINEAYNILKDPEKKRKYDRSYAPIFIILKDIERGCELNDGREPAEGSLNRKRRLHYATAAFLGLLLVILTVLSVIRYLTLTCRTSLNPAEGSFSLSTGLEQKILDRTPRKVMELAMLKSKRTKREPDLDEGKKMLEPGKGVKPKSSPFSCPEVKNSKANGKHSAERATEGHSVRPTNTSSVKYNKRLGIIPHPSKNHSGSARSSKKTTLSSKLGKSSGGMIIRNAEEKGYAGKKDVFRSDTPNSSNGPKSSRPKPVTPEAPEGSEEQTCSKECDKEIKPVILPTEPDSNIYKDPVRVVDRFIKAYRSENSVELFPLFCKDATENGRPILDDYVSRYSFFFKNFKILDYRVTNRKIAAEKGGVKIEGEYLLSLISRSGGSISWVRGKVQWFVVHDSDGKWLIKSINFSTE